nr:MAG TPA: hypothetical protein [Caudoviricetes sp.]
MGSDAPLFQFIILGGKRSKGNSLITITRLHVSSELCDTQLECMANIWIDF